MKKFLVMLISCSLLATYLCACNTSPDANIGENITQETAATTEPVETRTPHAVPEELDFGGTSFTICIESNLAVVLCDLYFQEESSSDNMLAAVYNRRMQTEDYLNVKMKAVQDVPYEELRSLFQAGDDIYQQFVLDGINNSVYLLDGLLLNVETLPYLDLDAEWWNQEVNDSLKVSKYNYLVVSDYMITDPFCMYFNRDMIVDNNFSDPYEMVLNGTWTLDKVIDMSIEVRNDVNGDGDFYGEDDIIGIITDDPYVYMGFMTGSARFMTERDENGRIISNFANELTYSALDQIYRLYENPGSYYAGALVSVLGYGIRSDTIDNGTALFTLGQINQMEHMVGIDSFTVGVVPFPKFNESQERYYSLDWSSVLAIPSTVRNKELVGAVTEYLSWESGNQVVPTYYEKLLKTRYSADPETRQMLELIFDTVYLEVGITYLLFTGFTGCAYICNTPLVGGNNYAAFFRVDKRDVKVALEDFYNGIDIIEGLEVETTEQ